MRRMWLSEIDDRVWVVTLEVEMEEKRERKEVVVR